MPLCRCQGGTLTARWRRIGPIVRGVRGAGRGRDHAIINGVTDSSSPRRGSPPLLSLRDAAAITGLPRREIRARVRRGEVAVRLLGKGSSAKLRLTPRALADAGLLGPDMTGAGTETTDTSARLLDLIDDQRVRIAALEDQRFQLAGQLGAAIERSRALEEQMRALDAPPAASDAPARLTTRTHARAERRAPRPPGASEVDAVGAPRGMASDVVIPAGMPPRATTDTIVATAMREAAPAAKGLPDPGGPSRAWRAGALLRRGARQVLRRPEGGPRSTH